MLIKNIGQLITFDSARDQSLGAIEQAAVLIRGDAIEWVGCERDLPSPQIEPTIDAGGHVVMPGLIDCHSHLIFAGSRAGEFAQRMRGQSYEASMQEDGGGGGISSTVKATLSCSDEELLILAKQRADQILKMGVTTLEVKSGYGLDTDAELRILRLLKKLSGTHRIDIHPTFLGAHVVPAKFRHDPKQYVDKIIHEMLPAVADQQLALDCDVFCEDKAFSLKDARAILSNAHELGLGLRAHVQQLKASGGVKLVGELPMRSISHADFLSEEDISLISNQRTIVEALPFAALFLRSKQITPVKLLKNAGVSLAIATDFNPGSAMCHDLILAARLGVTYFGFEISDALRAITKNAACALGRTDIGHLTPHAKADLVITNCTSIDEIFYDWTKHPVSCVLKNGEVI